MIDAHEFMAALIATDRIIRASGRRIDAMKFISTYREINGSHQSANPRGPSVSTQARHAKRREYVRGYLTDHADRPLPEIAAGLGVTEKTVACLFSKMGVKRKWRN